MTSLFRSPENGWRSLPRNENLKQTLDVGCWQDCIDFEGVSLDFTVLLHALTAGMSLKQGLRKMMLWTMDSRDIFNMQQNTTQITILESPAWRNQYFRVIFKWWSECKEGRYDLSRNVLWVACQKAEKLLPHFPSKLSVSVSVSTMLFLHFQNSSIIIFYSLLAWTFQPVSFWKGRYVLWKTYVVIGRKAR